MSEAAAVRAITHVLFGYCRCVDEARLDEFAALYAEDGVHDDGRTRRTGRAEIRKMAEAVTRRYDATSHHASNVVVELIDAVQARAHSYIYAWHRKDGAPDLEVWGRYEDRLTYAEGRWLIAERKLYVAGVRGLDGDPGFRPAPRARP
jgi:ketosteroid isomerase-like protein